MVIKENGSARNSKHFWELPEAIVNLPIQKISEPKGGVVLCAENLTGGADYIRVKTHKDEQEIERN